MKEIVIVGSTRTPGGSFGGTLKRFSAPKLGAVVIKEVIKGRLSAREAGRLLELSRRHVFRLMKRYRGGG